MVRTNLQEFVGDVHVLSNLQVGSNLFANDLAANVLTVDGSIGSTFFIGDGGLLSNIATTLNEIVANPGGNTVSNTLVFESGADATSNTAIATLSNVGISISNTEPTGEFQFAVGSNIFVNTHASNVLTVVGAIGSDLFIGDGGLLSNIATTLDQIVDQGNTVSNTIQLISGADVTSNTGLVTHKDVGISVSNTEPTGEFQFGVGSNLLVNVYSSNVLAIEGNVSADKMTLGTITVTSAYGLNHVTAQGSVTGDTISLTNATTGLTADSNIVVGGNVTAETVITSANVEVGDRLKFASNVFVDDLRVPDVAANLVTYDKTTGELMDSGGLFANKLAVVSVQPPSALSANTTTIAKHGTYTVTTSGLAEYSNAWNAFDGDSAVEWTSPVTYGEGDGVYSGTSNLFAGNYIQTGVSSAGEWLAIEFPYKTTLRHMKLTPPATATSYPTSANVYATNDSLTWTEVVNWSDVNPGDQQSNVQTIIVNATESFKKYAMVMTKTNGSDTNTALAEWKVFTESFSIDGGKVEMATSMVMGGETTMDQHGPHSRGEAKLKKYPEIVFDASKLDGNDTANVHTQAGYTVTASSQYPDRFGWEAFNDTTAEWLTADNTYATDGSYLAGGATFSSNGVDYTGNWLKIKLPNRVNIKKINITSYDKGTTSDDRRPKTGVFLGSNDDSSWEIIHRFNDDLTWNGASATGISTITNISNLNLYKYILLVVEEIQPNTVGKLTIREIEYYGYEEDPPTGDTSVDTTFTSIMNTPQTTGAQVYTDAKLSSDFTNRVTGPTVSNTHTTYVSAEKYWELSGNVESNVTIEANTFLSGDQPHAVSVWFNSSNLEANVSNTCVFSIASEEKLDSVNLDLQSNTWHNLTYSYQGEGGSRVTYLDGRKVAEDQAEDTFGEYPPFAMTGYSQGGYVVSASDENATWPLWRIFAGDSDFYVSSTSAFPGGVYTSGSTYNLGTNSGGSGTDNGHWIKLAVPYKLKISHVNIDARTGYVSQAPKNFKFYGSNDDTNWEQIGPSFSNEAPQDDGTSYYTLNSTKAYKYIGLVVTETVGDGNGRLGLQQLKLYGHRENDLVRLPDPTRVLKYPHIAMTGPAQRGYVVSVSSEYNNTVLEYRVFDGSYTNAGAWISGADGYDTNGIADNGNGDDFLSGIVGVGSENGAWIKLQMPHKIVLSYLNFYVRDPSSGYHRQPKSGYIYGSNDDSSFDRIGTFTRTTTTAAGTPIAVNINATTAYKYIVFQVTATITGGTEWDAVIVDEIELYGTGVDSIPIQIGGGNIDKVANFRVYDKFVGEDQALEIWDAQKDEFGRAKSSMTLHNGYLGIGTTEPEGRLAVLDEPDPDAYGLQRIPPKPASGYDTYIDGYGMFQVSTSDAGGSTAAAYWAFDHDIDRNSNSWRNSGSPYTSGTWNSTQTASTTENSNTHIGHWLQLYTPVKYSLKSHKVSARSVATYRQPYSAVVLGSTDGSTWNFLDTWTTTDVNRVKRSITIDNTTLYSYFRLVVKALENNSDAVRVDLGEWELYGFREQLPPKQSVFHDGQLTLTKSLTVPRIGPALDADDTPRRDRLVVEYNTSTNPTFEGAVRDTSGRGNDIVMYGNAKYDVSEKAFRLDGTTGTYMSGTQNLGTGTPAHTITGWFKQVVSLNNWTYVMFIGTSANGKQSGMLISNTGQIVFDIYNTRIDTTVDAGTGIWHHFAGVFKGGTSTWDNASTDLYINGQLEGSAAPDSGTQYSFNLTGNGIQFGTSTSSPFRYFNGSISNFKLYDCALTAQEVKTLYDMGRCSNAIPKTLHIMGGMMRYNNDINRLQIHNGLGWTTIGGVSAVGGTIEYINQYTVH